MYDVVQIPSKDFVLKISREIFRGSNYVFIGSEIGTRQLRKLKEDWKFSEFNDIYFIYDSTVFSSLKKGLLIHKKGITFKDEKGIESSISWDNYSQIIIDEYHSNLRINGFLLDTVTENRIRLMELLTVIKAEIIAEKRIAIQALVKVLQAKVSVEVSPKNWFLGINEKITGPFESNEIVNMISQNEIGVAMVWQQGMRTWQRLIEHESFNEITKNKKINSSNLVQQESNNEIFTFRINECELNQLYQIECFSAEKSRIFIEERKLGKIIKSMDELIQYFELMPHQVLELKNKVVFANSTRSRFGRKVDY